MRKFLVLTVFFIFALNFAKSQGVTLSSPANGSTVSGVSISIYWNGINGSTYYDYQYDTVSTFNSPALVTGSRSSSYIMSLFQTSIMGKNIIGGYVQEMQMTQRCGPPHGHLQPLWQCHSHHRLITQL